MEAKGVAAMMALLETAYPRFYVNQSADKKRAAMALWADAFAEYPEEAVRIALVRLIKESPFPPAISDVIQRVESMKSAGTDGIEELWAMLVAAMSDGYYHAKERFDALPRVCQRFVGSPGELRAMSQLNEDDIRTVTRGQFMRRAQSLMDQEKILQETPPHVLQLVRGLADEWKLPSGNDIHILAEGITEQQ